MQFGLCAMTRLDLVYQAASWGFDYVDIAGPMLVPLETDRVWQEQRRRIEDTGARVEGLNSFMPAEASFVGPAVDWSRVTDYLDTAISRAAEIGIHNITWGSAAAKSVPDGWSMAAAFEQVERASHLIADLAGKNGLTVVIEPINPRECNIMYYVTDALHLARVVGRPEIRVLADYYHMMLQNEPLEHIMTAREYLAYTHTADLDRVFPALGVWDQRPFLTYLRRAGYDGNLSFESWTVAGDFGAAARESLARMRSLWADVERDVAPGEGVEQS
ncbi:MAG TPA: sugar phosphate isomerase/epimerase family protein [Chloroflexota bacterium]|nr:sugar phosphate isomerase/epimerase family protein [Chloroflexota bacterium]